MKKLFAFLGGLVLLLAIAPLNLLAEGTAAAGQSVPFWLCLPFAGLLLCIALLPLVRPVWWEGHQPLSVAVLSALFILPFAATSGTQAALETVLECLVGDYLPFIVLLFGLFCVAGNITLEGDLAGSPRVNVGLLLFGTLLASCVGTTGASMLMAYYGVFHLFDLQSGRLPDPHRRSAALDGLYAGRAVFLEPASFSYHDV